MSALHTAAREGDAEKLRTLIAEGTDVNATDHIKRTALHLAAFSGHADCVQALVEAPCDVKLCAVDDTNALHFAAQKGHMQACRRLINAGLGVNVRNRKGATALILASQNGHAELVQFLLQRKANPAATNKAGKTAQDVAKTPEIRKILAEHMSAQPASKAQPAAAAAADSSAPAADTSHPHVAASSAGGKDEAMLQAPAKTLDAEANLPSASAPDDSAHAGPYHHAGKRRRADEVDAASDQTATGGQNGGQPNARGLQTGAERGTVHEQPDRPAKSAKVVMQHLGDEEDD